LRIHWSKCVVGSVCDVVNGNTSSQNWSVNIRNVRHAKRLAIPSSVWSSPRVWRGWKTESSPGLKSRSHDVSAPRFQTFLDSNALDKDVDIFECLIHMKSVAAPGFRLLQQHVFRQNSTSFTATSTRYVLSSHILPRLAWRTVK
jgi:hypothetical protein